MTEDKSDFSYDSIVHYSHFVKTTVIYPKERALEYLGLGISSEVGELLGHFKKYIRDGKWDQQAVKKELGDIVWYWTNICNEMGVDPRTILDMNMEKLRDRKDRDKLGGSGDDR